MPGIPIGLIEIMFFELFAHYLALYFQTFGCKRQAQHPVALKPESRLHILHGQLQIIVGYIVSGIGVILAAGHLQGLVIVRDVHTAAKHEVLKQVGKSCPFRGFIPRPYIIKQIHCKHRGGIILMH